MTTAEKIIVQSDVATLSRSELEADHALALHMFAHAPPETVEDWRETVAIYAREFAAREAVALRGEAQATTTE